MSDPKKPPDSEHFKNFRELAEKLVNVPKKEADRAEAAYQRERKKHPKRGPKPQDN